MTLVIGDDFYTTTTLNTVAHINQEWPIDQMSHTQHKNTCVPTSQSNLAENTGESAYVVPRSREASLGE